MRRRTRRSWVGFLATVSFVVVLTTTAQALPSVTAIAITLKHGTSSSSLGDIQTSNNVYYTVAPEPTDPRHRVDFIVTFALGSTPHDTVDFIWEARADLACNFTMALYKWKAKRWVTGASGYITSGSDSFFTFHADPSNAFVKHDTVRGRVTCASRTSYNGLLSDYVQLTYY